MKSKLGSKIKSRMNLKSMIIARLGGVVGGRDPQTKTSWSRTERFGPGPRTGPEQF